IIGRGHENPSMQELLLAIKTDIEGGATLAESLAKHPYHFDELYCNLIHAGEQAGILEDLLDKIATYKERVEAIK
ncbi:MAG: type II secretion system F family protein, partial [Desulfuromonadales bacterium]|nr:type II secretion system F family protein [Desulfuromonadales bacterium]NIS41523.1 type II secretion system F family protein [Desulfuromonadales bacterium]